MRRKTILALAAIWEIPDGIVKLALTLTKEIYSPLMMLAIFGGMFVTAATAQTLPQTKILATAAHPTTDEATQKRVDELIKKLGERGGGRSITVRKFAAKELGEIGNTQAIPHLIKLLKDRYPEVRQFAAIALGKIGDTRAVPPLINALGDRQWVVRLAATRALGKIGDTRAVQPLIKAMGEVNESPYSSPDDSERGAAISALGEIGDSSAVQPLIKALGDTHYDVRKEAAKALGQIGNPQAVQALRKASKDYLQDVRTAAKEALIIIQKKLGLEKWTKTQVGQTTIPATTDAATQKKIDELINQLGDEFVVRNHAAWSLGQIGDPQAVQPLIKALGDENEFVRRRAAWSLGQIGDSQAVQPLIKKALEDEDPLVREHAVRSLGQIGDPQAVPPLTEALEDRYSQVRRLAATAIELIKSKVALEEQAKATGEKEPAEVKEEQVKAETMEEERKEQTGVVEEKPSSLKTIGIGIVVFIVLGGIGAVLVKFLKDRSSSEIYDDQDDQYVDETADDPFSEIDEPQTVQSLINDLLDEDPLVRENAAVNLGQAGDKQAIRPLAKALKDEEQTVRKAARESLIQVLIRILDDKDPRSRAMATKTLGQIGDKRSINPLIKTLKDKDETVSAAAKQGLALIRKKLGPEEWAKIIQNRA